MGNFETLVGRCPDCGHEAEVQTKTTTERKELRTLTEGMKMKLREDMPRTFTLECKNTCKCCGAKLVAVVEDETFIGFTKEEPDLIESVFGLVLETN